MEVDQDVADWLDSLLPTSTSSSPMKTEADENNSLNKNLKHCDPMLATNSNHVIMAQSRNLVQPNIFDDTEMSSLESALWK